MLVYVPNESTDHLSVSSSTLRWQMWGSFCRRFQSTPTANLLLVPRSQAARTPRARSGKLPGSMSAGPVGKSGRRREEAVLFTDTR